MNSYTTLSTEVQGNVFVIGLNRPQKYNAFNLLMLQELAQAYSEFENAPQLWCALLFGHGDNFTSGLDLAEVGPAVAQGKPLFSKDDIDPLDLFDKRRTKPVLCAVQGWCLTIGIELLLACDIRIASENTIFSQMEINRGIMPFGGATIRMPQLSGWGNAMYHLLTGDKFDAKEALRIGLVQEVATAGSEKERALEIAHLVASRAPLAVQASRASAAVAVEQGMEKALEGLMDQARSLMDTEDAAEGLRSFKERRSAKFRGC